jgi:hypothetical protein
MARSKAVGKVGLIDILGRAWRMFSMAGLTGAKSSALASTGGVAAGAGSFCGSNDLVMGIALASIVAVVVVVAKCHILTESAGLLPAEGSDPEAVPCMALAEGVDLGMAVRHQTELQSSLLEPESEPESPPGDLHNTRQIPPDDDHQSVDCRTPTQANMAGLLDDTGCHKDPAEYPGAVAGCPDGRGRQECYQPTVVSGIQGFSMPRLPFFLFFSLDDPGRRGCELSDLDQPIRTHSMR